MRQGIESVDELRSFLDTKDDLRMFIPNDAAAVDAVWNGLLAIGGEPDATSISSDGSESTPALTPAPVPTSAAEKGKGKAQTSDGVTGGSGKGKKGAAGKGSPAPAPPPSAVPAEPADALVAIDDDDTMTPLEFESLSLDELDEKWSPNSARMTVVRLAGVAEEAAEEMQVTSHSRPFVSSTVGVVNCCNCND